MTMSNRPQIHEDIGKVIGDFTIVNIMEINQKREDTFLERLTVLQERLWEDLSHGSFTGVEVLREMGRNSKEHALIPVVFTSTLGADEQKERYERRGTLRYKISRTPQVLIDCQVMEQDKTLCVNWDVRKGVFSAGIVEQAFEAFETLLRRMVKEPSIWKELANVYTVTKACTTHG